jgi:predicted nucleic acid-binding protein
LSDDEAPASRPVLVDTDVFSRVYVTEPRDDDATAWAQALEGRTVVIAVQTAVELRVWPLLKKWGNKRTQRLTTLISSVPTIQISQDVQDRYVELTTWAKNNGHGLQAKANLGDRWIAATALAHDLELAARDGIYDGVAGLRLLKKTS